MNVREWRESIGLSQALMAGMLRVPVATYLKWDQGIREPRGPTLEYLRLIRWLQTLHPGVWNAYSKSNLDK